MAQYQAPHPWNAGFAVPRYILAEPQGRGTFTTKQLPRRTISQFPQESRQIWNRTRWAAPDYTQGRYDKSAQTTKMLPRRTVSALAPDIFQRPGAAVAMGSVLDGASIGGESTLGAFALPRAKFDPIVEYGRKGSQIILGELNGLPRAKRQAELLNVLDSLGIGFRADVEAKVKAYKARGHKPKAALEKAIAATLSNKMFSDILRAGKGAVHPLSGYSPVGFSLGGIVKSIGNKLGDLHCAVVSSDLGKTAATVAGGAVGGPGGAAAANMGVNVLSSPCGGGGKKAPPTVAPPPPPPPSFPIVPVAIAAGGALVLFMVLK
jgi:hypothetical protein